MSAASLTSAPQPGAVSESGQAVPRNLQTYALIVALIVIWGIFLLPDGGAFLGPQNFSNLFRQMTVTAFLSVGMVLVIVTGDIDLSVGKLAGFVSVVVAYFQARHLERRSCPTRTLLTTILSVLVGLAVGTLFGITAGLHHRLLAGAGLYRHAGRHVGLQRRYPDRDRRARPSPPTSRSFR